MGSQARAQASVNGLPCRLPLSLPFTPLRSSLTFSRMYLPSLYFWLSSYATCEHVRRHTMPVSAQPHSAAQHL